ncbi:MAG: FliA/WhiG family RNA polymerase sigma factor [Acidobacteriota bacterium]|nr:FliA/WhiG family RNA polymerase sigma factor [Acidobacteriota bacterium]
MNVVSPSEYADPDFDEIILSHMPQVRTIASRICNRLTPRVELNDLISAGTIGLLKAIDRFDSSRNICLKTYAEYKIRGAILDTIRTLDGVQPHKRKRIRQVEDAIAASQQKLQRAPTQEEIAAELNLTLQEYQLWMVELRKVTLMNCDITEDEDEPSLWNLISSDEEEASPARILERSELARILSKAIDKLPLNERTVLSMYYRDELMLREIASAMNIHTSRVSQLRTQAVLRLRSYLSAKWPKQGGAVLKYLGNIPSPDPAEQATGA